LLTSAVLIAITNKFIFYSPPLVLFFFI
jgi:hypothetical protein